MRNNNVSSIFFLQIAVAVFFLSAGIVGIINYNSTTNEVSRAVGDAVERIFGVSQTGRSNANLNLAIAILQLISGAMLLVGSIVSFQGKSGFFAALVIFALWALKIVYSHVLYDFGQPDILVWLYRLSPDLVVLAALWMVTKRYA